MEISVSDARLDLHSDPYMHVSRYWTIVVDFPTSAGDFIYDVGFLLVRLFCSRVLRTLFAGFARRT